MRHKIATVLIVLLAALAAAPTALAVNHVEIESKLVQKNDNVQLGLFFVNDEPLQAFVVPYVVRNVTGGAFWVGNVDTLPWTGRLTSCLTFLRVHNLDLVDSVSPDQVLLSGLKLFECGMAPGDDIASGTPSITLTFDVNAISGTFEIDTLVYPVSSDLAYVRDPAGTEILPTFTKGIVEIEREPCPTASWGNPGPIDGDPGDNLTNSITAQLPPGGPGTVIIYDQVAGPGTTDANGVWTWTPGCGDVGPYQVDVEVTDDAHVPGECDIISFTGTIAAPVVSMGCGPTMNIHWGTTGSRTITASSPCGAVTLTQSSGPGILNGNDWSWIPDCVDIGSYTVVIQGQDPLGGTAQCSFTVNVTNTAPRCNTLTPSQFEAGSLINVQLPADGGGDGDDVAFTFVSGPDSVDVDSTGNLTWQTQFADTGSFQVCVSVDDGCEQTECCYIVVVTAVPCECHLHGDISMNNIVDVIDVVAAVDEIFRSRPPRGYVTCPVEIGDVNGIFPYDVLDVVYIIDYVFRSGPCPVYPCTGEVTCQQ